MKNKLPRRGMSGMAGGKHRPGPVKIQGRNQLKKEQHHTNPPKKEKKDKVLMVMYGVALI